MKIIWSIIISTFLITMITTQEVVEKWEYQWQETSDITKISNNWNITFQKNFPTRKNAHLWLRVKIPKNTFVDPSLYIRRVCHHFTVFIEEKVLYQHGNHLQQETFVPYSLWHTIRLPQNSQGKYILFCTSSKLDQIGIRGDVVLANENIHYKNMIKEDVSRLLIGFICLFFGLLQVLLFLRRKKENIYLFLGLFCISIGGYTLCWLDIKHFYNVSPITYLYIEYFCLYSMPIFFCSFFIQMFGTGPYNILPKNIAIHSLYLFCTMMLSFFDIFWLPSSLFIFQILFLITIFLVIFISFKAAIKGNHDAKLFIFGMIILSIFGVYDVVREFEMISWSKSRSHWGIFIFMMSIAILLERRFYYIKNQIEKINKACSRFIPWKFIKLLGHENITEVSLGDQVEITTTVLFSDIRAFTTISEKMTPQENFDFINSYLKEMVPIICKYGGLVDKYIGDAVMAVFSDPHYALQASKEMIFAIKSYSEKHNITPPIEIGIGVHTGTLMLGIIGESERMECTVIADAVNTASRLESLTKKYKVNIITSKETINALKKDISHRFLEEVIIRGKQKKIPIFEVLIDLDKKNE